MFLPSDPIESSGLGLSVRAVNALHREGITVVGQLIRLSEDQVLDIPNVGTKTCNQILKTISEVKISLGIHDDTEAAEVVDDGKVHYGDSVTTIGLSTRASNALMRNGVLHVSDLLELSPGEIHGFKNVGVTIAQEVLDKKTELESMEIVGDEAPAALHVSEDYALEKYLVSLFDSGIYDADKTDIKAHVEKNLKECHSLSKYAGFDSLDPVLCEELEEEIIRGDYFDTLFKRKLLDFLKRQNGATLDEIRAYFGRSFCTYLSNGVSAYVLNDTLEPFGDKLLVRKPTIDEFCNSLPEGRSKDCFVMRLNGFTLEEIGTKFGITGERARQIIEKMIRRARNLSEIKYAPLYVKYGLSKEAFEFVTEEHDVVWNYLKLVCVRPKDQPADYSGVLEADVPFEWKVRVEKYMYRSYIDDDGIKVKRTRNAIALHILRKHPDGMEGSDFAEEYLRFLDEYNLQSLEPHFSERAFVANVERDDHVLLKQGKKLRYFEMTDEDFEDLVDRIGIKDLKDVEISAEYFIDRYPDVMEEYDIHDEYELHNLLKRRLSVPGIHFSRQPIICIGNGSREKQVYDLLVEEAPVSNVDLAQRYSEEYGVQPATVLANFFKPIDVYFYKGVYSVDYQDLSEEEYAFMRSQLTGDVYAIEDVRKTFVDRFPSSDPLKLNSYTFKKLGYLISTNLMYSGRYSSIDRFARNYLSKSCVDLSGSRWLLQNQSFYGVLNELRSKREIIEYDADKFVSAEELEKYGVSRDEMADYADKVCAFLDGRYGTVSFLKQQGFQHPLQDLGYSDLFYASVIHGDPRMRMTTLAKTPLFKELSFGRISSAGLIVEIVQRVGYIGVEDLLSILYDDYGIPVKKKKLMSLLSESDLFYSSAMQCVYLNYEQYYDSI